MVVMGFVREGRRGERWVDRGMGRGGSGGGEGCADDGVGEGGAGEVFGDLLDGCSLVVFVVDGFAGGSRARSPGFLWRTHGCGSSTWGFGTRGER